MNNNVALADIRAFVAIADCGSFTRAADQLNASRAHLSRQLNQLEQQLGTQLLIRTTRSQRLTAAGEQFFRRCQEALLTIDQAIIESIDDSQQMHGRLAINCVGGFIGEELLGPMLAEFGRQYRDIELELDFSSQRVDLITEQFDLVVRMGALEDAGFIARQLTEITIETLASPDYLKRHGRPSDPRALKHHNCLTGSVKRWSYTCGEGASKSLDVQVAGNFSCKNGRVLLDAACQGNGIVRLPTLYCRRELAERQLVPVFEHWQAAPVPLHLLYHRNRYQPQRLKTLIDFVCQSFEKLK